MTELSMKATRAIAVELREKSANNVISFATVQTIAKRKSVSPVQVVGIARDISIEVTGLPASSKPSSGHATAHSPSNANKPAHNVSDLVMRQIMSGGIYRELQGTEDSEGFVLAAASSFRKERAAIIAIIEAAAAQQKADGDRIAELEQQLAKATSKAGEDQGESQDRVEYTDEQISRLGAESFFNIM